MSPLDFVRETNRIEGILREPKAEELSEFFRFMALDVVGIEDLKKFVSIYQPGAILRDRRDLNVRVGNHIAPQGGTEIMHQLSMLLTKAIDGKYNHREAFRIHQLYETLHPFTDCNGRSGRMLWAWMMDEEWALSLGFLHRWYYQSLDNARV